MTPLSDALSRLAAAGRIRSAWLPGMRDTDRGRIIGEDEDGISAPIGPDYERDHWTQTGTSGARWREPDLTDPATLGCLLALVREAYADPYLRVRYSQTHRMWQVQPGDVRGPAFDTSLRAVGSGPTEAEALTAALVAAAEATGA